ncbi:MAG: DDE-type integrase/transposase/recombinase [Oricola sp.]
MDGEARLGCCGVSEWAAYRSHGAALKELNNAERQETGRWMNNRAENSHLSFRRRERAMLRFRRMRNLQKPAAIHASAYNHFNQERSLSSRAAALAVWRGLFAAWGVGRSPRRDRFAIV